jgi:hypothetical protein
MAFAEIKVEKVIDSASRAKALQVIAEVYLKEKNWIRKPEDEIAEDIGSSTKHSWFLVSVGTAPAGVIRLTYDPSLELPPELDVTWDEGINLEELAKNGRFVDIGRFMILSKFRHNIRIVLRLIRDAIQEVVERGYTHFITDVFESDPNSPLHFHTRVLGFERIGTHKFGELNCSSVRIILVLDILKSYQKLKAQNNKVYQEVTEGIRELLDAKVVEKG